MAYQRLVITVALDLLDHAPSLHRRNVHGIRVDGRLGRQNLLTDAGRARGQLQHLLVVCPSPQRDVQQSQPSRHLESRAKAAARLGLEVSAGRASSSSRGLWDGDALLLSTRSEFALPWGPKPQPLKTKPPEGARVTLQCTGVVALLGPRQCTAVPRLDVAPVQLHGAAGVRLRLRVRAAPQPALHDGPPCALESKQFENNKFETIQNNSKQFEAHLRAVGEHRRVVRPQRQAALVVPLGRSQVVSLERGVPLRLLRLRLLLRVAGLAGCPRMDEAIQLAQEALQIRVSLLLAGRGAWRRRGAIQLTQLLASDVGCLVEAVRTEPARTTV